eukprot:TRINITY_DN9868_c0_g1_i3.p2 TRINITY_DN9868_c0_g1~~TRINITY_DN9868_c0_g1_i3.p2  ORF type:complete len:117 (+),score=22.23 TRINITY_DN9868_c0_g1_i3:62-412(+)
MIRRPPRSTHCISSAASDVYKRQLLRLLIINLQENPLKNDLNPSLCMMLFAILFKEASYFVVSVIQYLVIIMSKGEVVAVETIEDPTAETSCSPQFSLLYSSVLCFRKWYLISSQV